MDTFSNKSACPQIVDKNIERGYKMMAEDAEYVVEAGEWIDGFMDDILCEE